VVDSQLRLDRCHDFHTLDLIAAESESRCILAGVVFSAKAVAPLLEDLRYERICLGRVRRHHVVAGFDTGLNSWDQTAWVALGVLADSAWCRNRGLVPTFGHILAARLAGSQVYRA